MTYSEQNCPLELRPSDTQKFLKRLRRLYEPARLRYYLCGEYGDKTFRPHYHAALFGVSVLDHHFVDKAWGLGFVQLGELNATTAMYIAGYVCKKMTDKEDPRLMGRHPEFARMSRRPHGIGQGACASIAKGLVEAGGSAALLKRGDVPETVRIDGKELPLGRYLRRQVRDSVGWDESCPKEVVRGRAMEKSLQSDEQLRGEQQRRVYGAEALRNRQKIFDSKRKL